MAVPTIDEAIDAYLENADFEASASITKARAFQTAIKQLLILQPKMQADQNSSLGMNSQELLALLERSNAYIGAASASDSVKYLSFRHARR